MGIRFLDSPRLHLASAKHCVEGRAKQVDAGRDVEHGLPLLNSVLGYKHIVLLTKQPPLIINYTLLDGGVDYDFKSNSICTTILTFLVSALAMTGPTIPGIVAKELVMPNKMPAYLQ